MVTATENDATTQNKATLVAFQKAWVEKDLQTLMDLVTDDIVFSGSVGPEPGHTWAGKEAVREGFAHFLELDAGEAVTDPAVIVGNDGFAGWAWKIQRSDGTTQITRGFDSFKFRDGKIAVKDGFRKTVPSAGKPLVSPPGATDGSTDPYSRRWFTNLGMQQADGISIKMYWINADQNMTDPPAELRSAIDGQIEALVKEIHNLGSHHSQAYAIVHSGTAGTWLLFHWWAYGEINCHILMRAEPDSYDFYRVGDPRLNACVWESIVIEHERKAWVRNMLTDNPDPAAYQSDTLADGEY
ncbi:MAG: nuclear transport factor 2 family protein [Ruegeria sp.]